MNTLALYLRLSNDDPAQAESGSIQSQRDLLHAFIREHSEFNNWNIMEFKDDGWSGTTLERPALKRLLRLAGNPVRCIIVKDISRFGRNLLEIGYYLDSVFPFLGVRFIAVNEHYDSVNHIGSTVGLDIALRAMICELYSRDLSQKVTSVKTAQMKRGLYVCGRAFYGYQKTSAGKLCIDPEAAKVVQCIFSLAASGNKPAEIAVRLNREKILPPYRYHKQKHHEAPAFCCNVTDKNVWTRDSVRNLLKDARYTGCFVGRKRVRFNITSKKEKQLPEEKWIKVEAAQEAIVTKELFLQAQSVLEPWRSPESLRHPSEPFRGKIKCGCCGRSLQRHAYRNPFFDCPTGHDDPTSPCREIRIEKESLTQLILNSLEQMTGITKRTKTAPTPMDESQPCVYQPQEVRLKTQRMLLFEQWADGKLKNSTFRVRKTGLCAPTASSARRENDIALPPRGDSLEKPGECTPLREFLLTFLHTVRVLANGTLEVIWNFQDVYHA